MSINEMIESPDDLELDAALITARARGNELRNKFYESSVEEKIEAIARSMYFHIEIDPLGYPNGQPYWHELPDIDKTGTVGTDKMRYISAATAIYNMLSWVPNTTSGV